MSKAIGVRVRKPEGEYDLGVSKFFGTPTIPEAWEEDFSDTTLFFCQLRLADVAAWDKENRLPHTGYLYVFLDTADGERSLRPQVRYYAGQPRLALEEFNAITTGYEQYTQAWVMEFYPVEEDAACTRLLGEPSDWPYDEAPPSLLMQFDPLDSEMGFLDSLDGFIYLFFGENERDFAAVTLHTEYS